MNRFVFALLALAAATPSLLAQPAPSPATAAPATPPVLREISPDLFEFNGIRLDKKNHQITFPVIVNQHQGLIEYLLVNEKGKLHESLLSTRIPPHDIHAALLLIGLKESAKANSKDPAPPSAIDTAYLQEAPKLKGPSVQLTLAWTVDGKRKEVPAEDWIFNLQTKRTMAPGPWTYNGSMMENGVFLADQEFSLIAVITDPTALVNNPREGYNDDQIWQIQEKSVPPIDTPVELTIALADSAPAKP